MGSDLAIVAICSDCHCMTAACTGLPSHEDNGAMLGWIERGDLLMPQRVADVRGAVLCDCPDTEGGRDD